MKVAGILGGLGPQSTALFYEEIIRLAQARKEVSYPRMIINSMSVWDFSSKMKDETQLIELMSKGIAMIEKQVDFLAMVCNTAHSIIQPLRAATRLPLLAIQEEVVAKIREDGLKKVGILGTQITTTSGMYQQELDKYGIAHEELPARMLEPFDDLIFNEMLHGNSYAMMHLKLKEYAQLLHRQGCEGIILGCTEFPLFLTQQHVEVPLYPSTQILAASVMKHCLEA
ncbi:MAG: amino acid racemase [Bacteroidetes bacterium]|nr:MAG: amino acid racemase [Bacteroidota bacterium]